MPAAGALADGELLDLFNRAYSDYLVPLGLDLATLGRIVESSDIDLAASPVAELEGAPVGFALLGIRGHEGWIGGMGVVPEERRRGLGAALTEAALEEARVRGVRIVRLEVLEQNEPAILLYARLGFEHERDLDVWSLADGGPPVAEAAEVEVADAHRWISERRPSREPWQRADGTLAHVLRGEPVPGALELRDGGERVGAVVHAAAGGSATVLQLAVTGDEPVERARLLVEAVRTTGDGVRWLNAPADEPGSAAMEALGATRVARQHELVLPLA